ncbi:autotransporter-associated beta strand repeat-containing protein [Noviherbaspirillum pedocola]|uniref:Autotransporter-associated beta strand repeat-containing protein n=1 Tax=Noviherbaspirillum pedocola TaxID=2801341 RepID=A0A934W7W1_9BURK|nr:autotransporter-associated beta strand repeat-containing protein [Noviherbaspirillum pedocola]MBK4735114.1 autotransporter-associated beta strand repeat-containing protein [Noviherbaspirillum pedocola]
MNHTYRLIWNECSKMFVAVSELARARGKSRSSKALIAPESSPSKRYSHRGNFALRALLGALALMQMNFAAAHTDSLGWIITPDSNGTSTVNIIYGSWHSGNVGPEGSIVLTGPNGYSATSAFALVPNFVNVSNGVLPGGLTLGQNYFFPNTATSAVDFTSSSSGHNIYAFQQTTFAGLGSGLYNFGYAAGPLTAVWTPSDAAINAGTFTINSDGSITVIGAPSTAPVNHYIDTTNGNLAPTLHDTSSTAYSQTTLTFDGGTLQYGADTVTSKNATINATGGTVDTNGHGVAMTGTISGNGGLSKTGTGTLVLSGANTFQGGVTIGAGTVQVSADANLGDSAGAIAINGATLQTTASFATARNIALTGTGTISTDSGTTLTDSGNVSGSGGLVKDGAGTLVLNGGLSHAGGNSVNNGTLVLGGNNSYTGGNVVNAGGTLQVATNAALGNAANGVALNGGTLHATGSFDTARGLGLSGNAHVNVDADDTLASTGTVSGSGALVKDGAGTLVLNGGLSHAGGNTVNNGTLVLGGNNSYTGGNVVNAGGTLQVATNAALGNAANGVALNGGTLHATGSFNTARSLTLGGNAHVNVDANDTLASTGTVSGSGALVKDGAGTLALNGVVSHAGGNTVNNGTLVLGGNNSYTGGNVVNAGGTLQVATDAALGNAANGVALNGGTLHATGSFDTARGLGLSGNAHVNVDADDTLASTGTVSGSGALVKDGAGTLALNGVVSHAGGNTVNNGTLVLGGTNSYTGGNVVNAGATLQVGTDAALGDASNGVALNGGTLRATDSFNTARSLALGGNASVNVDASNTVASTGTVSGNGGLVKDGAGTLVLNGALSHGGGNTVNNGTLVLGGNNSYTGGNVINAGGTLQVATDAALGDASNGVALNDGTLQATGSFDTARNLTLGGNASVNVDANNTVGSTGAVSGNGALIKDGAGTLVLNGALSHGGGNTVNNGTLVLGGNNSYTGGNVVNAGATLQVGTDAALGDASNGVALNGGTLRATGSFNTARSLAIDSNAQVSVDGNNTVASTGAVSGNGALIKDGAGTLNIAGNASHGGGTIVNNGTLVLGGNNSYTGGNVVNAGGTLQVAKDASLGAASNVVVLNGGTLATTATFDTARNVTLASNSSINVADGTTLTEKGQFSGSGRLYKDGSGTLVLTGDNIAWTGGTTIDAGLVKVTSPTGIGTGDVILNGGIIQTTVTLTTGQKINVAANTTIYTDANTTTTLTGTMSNTELGESSDGCFIKSGAGTLNMAGTATLKNGTCVQQGMLRANGVLNSIVTVDQGAYLRGSGLVTGPITVSGTLAPGNSPGTLTVSSTVTMNPGSAFQADINGLGTASGPGNYSRLLITGAGNQYIANGATLLPNLVNITGANTYTPYVPQVGDTFRIVTAEGGINGRFAPLTQPQGMADGTRMAVFYNVANSNSIDLRVVPVSYASYFAPGLNTNATSAARALDKAMALNDAGTATDTQTVLTYGIAGVSASQLPNLVRTLAGEVHGAIAAVAPLAGQSLQNTVARQLSGATPSNVSAQEALWADLSGNHGRWTSDTQSSGFTANRTQLTVGADMVKNGDTRFGAGLSHAQSNVSASAGSGSVEQNLAFVYGEQAVGGVKVDALAGIGRSTWDSRRGDPFQIAGVLENNAKGSDALVSLGVRAPWQLHGFALEPFARVMWQRSRRDGFQENTATPAALQLSDYSANGTRMLVGVAGGSQVRDPLAAKATVRYSVGVGRDSGNLAQAAVSASLAGMGTSIVSPDVGRSFVQASVEGTAKLGKGAYAYYGLNGEARSGKNDVGVTGGVRISF